MDACHRDGAHDWVNGEEAAALLGISSGRLRQLVAQKRLAVLPLSDRFTAYPMVELRRLQEARGGGRSSTGVAALLSEPAQPLVRTHDRIVHARMHDAEMYPVHVRVWQEPGHDRSERVVVLVSSARGGDEYVLSSEWEYIAAAVDEQLLAGRGDVAVWFEMRVHKQCTKPQVDNIVTYIGTSNRVAGWFGAARRRRDNPEKHFQDSTWRDSSTAEIRRLTGCGPVEVYPAAISTPETIERRTRNGGVVDVEVDSTNLGRMVGSLAVLDAVPADDPWRSVAARAAQDLAQEIRTRESILDDHPPHDGSFRDPDVVLAARIVRRPYTAADQALVDRHHGTKHLWPWSPEDLRDNRELRDYQRRWLEDVDQYAEHPDPIVEEAVRTATDLLTIYIDTTVFMRDQDIDPGDALVDEDFYPRSELRSFSVNDPLGRAYLAALTPAGPIAMNTREGRIIQETIDKWMFVFPKHEPPTFAHDQSGRLVAVLVRPASNFWGPPPAKDVTAVVTMWPHEAPRLGLPDDAELVADGNEGDLAVYIRYRTGELDLLPWQPHHLGCGWNFGYSGGGPAYLEAAIERAYALTHRIAPARLPTKWIEDAVEHSPMDHLRISIGDITRRVT